jgi:hypothetical protein
MLTLGFSLVLVSCIYGVWRLSTRASEHRYGWPAVWRLACVIAAVRISALWLGQAGLSRTDWLQVPAYFALMLELPEIYIVRGARTAALWWAMLGSMILAATSFLWASAFFWLANRLRIKGRRGLS